MSEDDFDKYRSKDKALLAACRYPESYTESMPEEFELTLSVRMQLDAPKPPSEEKPGRFFGGEEYAPAREERARALHGRLSDLLKALRREIEAHAGHLLEIEPKTESKLLKLMLSRQLTNGGPDKVDSASGVR